MPMQPETLPREPLCATVPEQVFVHMVTLQGLRHMLLKEAVNARCSVREDRRLVL
jgi:hypothetical protein